MILDPPTRFVLKQNLKETKTSNNHSITSCSCEVSQSNPRCNISWNSDGIVVEETTNVSGDMTDGFTTRSFITLKFPTTIDKQAVTCHAQCGSFYKSDTLQLQLDKNNIDQGKFWWNFIICRGNENRLQSFIYKLLKSYFPCIFTQPRIMSKEI